MRHTDDEWTTAASAWFSVDPRVRYRLRAIGSGAVRIMLQTGREIQRLEAPGDRQLWVEFELPGVMDGETHESYLMHGQTRGEIHWSVKRADLPDVGGDDCVVDCVAAGAQKADGSTWSIAGTPGDSS